MYAIKFVFDPDKFDQSLIEYDLWQIRIKDPTFKFSLHELKDGKVLLIIYAKDKDQAHKRGLWVRRHIFVDEVGYKVEEVKT